MNAFVPSEYLSFGDAIDRVASDLHIQKREAQQTLRQLLYSGQVPSRIIERNGQPHDTPTHVWGGVKWGEALKSGTVCFEVAAYASDTHGRIIILQKSLIETLKLRIPQKTETHQRDERICELYKNFSEKPNLTCRAIFDLMKTQYPDLLKNRRTRGNTKIISLDRFKKIIREQRKI